MSIINILAEQGKLIMNLIPNIIHPYFSSLKKRKSSQELLLPRSLLRQMRGSHNLTEDLILGIINPNALLSYLELIVHMNKFL